MPPRTPRTRATKSRSTGKKTSVTRRSRRDRELRQELEKLYLLDGKASSMTILHPPKARWLRRVAWLAPVAVAVQVFVIYGVPFIAHLWNRPEFLAFRLSK